MMFIYILYRKVCNSFDVEMHVLIHVNTYYHKRTISAEILHWKIKLSSLTRRMLWFCDWKTNNIPSGVQLTPDIASIPAWLVHFRVHGVALWLILGTIGQYEDICLVYIFISQRASNIWVIILVRHTNNRWFIRYRYPLYAYLPPWNLVIIKITRHGDKRFL